MKVTQSCPTVCDTMDYTDHGILQARIPEWVAFPSPGDLPHPGVKSRFPGSGKIPWRRERLPTPVFWPGEFHGLYSPWGYKESDTTVQLSFSPGSSESLCQGTLEMDVVISHL